ncbi:MAG: TIGR04255 family protein [Candidatus Marinimicrobia bacterium]|nr:TIGR04255 family protein [Candidatus Neomarinimicrobiota bacterium]
MSSYPHLKNAPIREALFDIHVKMPDDTTIERIEEFGQLIKDDYPQVSKQWLAKVRIKPGSPPERDEEPEQIGYRFISKSNKQVLQIRLNGFTFSRLRPYETWEKLRDESKRLWNLFVESLKPITIERVACRFINELALEMPVNIDDLVASPPLRVKGLPEVLEAFLTRVVIPNEELSAKTIITQSFDGVDQEGKGILILDIDVFKEGSFEVDNDDAWDVLESFHDYKNQIFFATITEHTMKKYK